MATASEEVVFYPEEVTPIVNQSVEQVLSSATYVHEKVDKWQTEVVEGILKRLCALEKPFKYVVTCVVMQKAGAGLHTTSSCFWDNDSDGCALHRWENDTMHVVTTVFGLAV